jgi:hypothetical protein
MVSMIHSVNLSNNSKLMKFKIMKWELNKTFNVNEFFKLLLLNRTIDFEGRDVTL